MTSRPCEIVNGLSSSLCSAAPWTSQLDEEDKSIISSSPWLSPAALPSSSTSNAPRLVGRVKEMRKTWWKRKKGQPAQGQRKGGMGYLLKVEIILGLRIFCFKMKPSSSDQETVGEKERWVIRTRDASWLFEAWLTFRLFHLLWKGGGKGKRC